LTDPQKTLRVRIRGNSASVAIKSRSSSIVRHEFEYAIPLADVQQMIQLFSIPTIEKIRHIVPYGGKTWEIDVYLSQNKGLIVGEIELVSENEQFDTPPWILNEISSDKRYSNSSLMLHPFSTW
jgi:adenylate cyclase